MQRWLNGLVGVAGVLGAVVLLIVFYHVQIEPSIYTTTTREEVRYETYRYLKCTDGRMWRDTCWYGWEIHGQLYLISHHENDYHAVEDTLVSFTWNFGAVDSATAKSQVDALNWAARNQAKCIERARMEGWR